MKLWGKLRKMWEKRVGKFVFTQLNANRIVFTQSFTILFRNVFNIVLHVVCTVVVRLAIDFLLNRLDLVAKSEIKF